MQGAVLTPLARIRKERGVSLVTLSRAVDYDRGGLSRIERGIYSPRRALAICISDFFGGAITPDQIMFPEEHIHAGAKKPIRSSRLQEVR